MSYSKHFLIIADEVDCLMKEFSHTKKDIGYGYRWTFDNKHWIDIIDYRKGWTTILRVWRGAWLVRKYPILHSWFDEVMVVLAKAIIPDIQTLYDKNLARLLKLIDQAPSGIGAFD